MFTIDEEPFGRSWEDWTSSWWKWFFSTPKENHPAYDETGLKSEVNLLDPNVWFLAGTTEGRAERTITIPAWKAVLLPVINVGTSYSENPSLRTEGEMMSFVNAHMKDIAKKEAIIDGDKVDISDRHRVRSCPFEFSFPSDNIYGVREGQTTGVGDGYWLFIKPLTRGTHYISTSGACMSGKIRIDVNIKLIVK
jgi:hypothetical protein